MWELRSVRSEIPIRFFLALVVFSGTGGVLWGKDFYQPALDPQVAPPVIGGLFLWEQSFYAATEWDSFLFRTASWGTLGGVSPVFIQYFFDSALLAGPLSPGENPSAAVAFWLNAVQFEYGFRGSFVLGTSSQGYLEYSRRSLHPLRPVYAQTSYDILAMGGEWRLEAGDACLLFHPRTAWLQMFPLWQSILPEYRELFRLEAAWELSHPLATDWAVFIGGRPTLIVTRKEDWGWDLTLESGLRFSRDHGTSEVYLRLTGADDTELLEAGPHRDFQVGLGLRLWR